MANMKWFKFYGQDFLTDPKMKVLDIECRMCWIVLMCLANAEDKNGEVHFVQEVDVMYHAGIEFDSPKWHETKGFLHRFQSMGMITIDNADETSQRYHVTLSNFQTRQERAMSGYERLKKYRNQRKNEVSMITNDNGDDNARLDKIRLDKRREDIYATDDQFEILWLRYPNRSGKKAALRHYLASVKSEEDQTNIGLALNNYLASGNVKNGYVKNGSTWFNEWRDWVAPSPQMMKGNNGQEKNQPINPNSQASRAGFRHTAGDIDRLRSVGETLRRAKDGGV